jgi:hypothetical protein
MMTIIITIMDITIIILLTIRHIHRSAFHSLTPILTMDGVRTIRITDMAIHTTRIIPPLRAMAADILTIRTMGTVIPTITTTHSARLAASAVGLFA